MAPRAENEPTTVGSRRIHARLFVWIVVTATLLLCPPPPPPALEDWPGPLMFLVGQADKLVHAGIFGVGAHVCARSLAALGGANPLVFGVLTSFAYGVVLEGVQSAMPRRSASFGDAVADLAGGLLYVAWVAWRRRRRSLSRRGDETENRVGMRFSPPPFELTPEINWVLIRAFGPASVRSPSPLAGSAALAIARALDLGARIAARNDRVMLVEELGAEAAEELSAIRRAAAAGGLALSASITEVAAAASTLDLPVVFLKYAALELSGRLLAGSRAAGDVDVLVPSERAQELQQALLGRGFSVAGSEEEHQLPALIHPRLGAVEVHRSILGLRLDGVRSASYSDLAERGLLAAPTPQAHRRSSATFPVRTVLAAHAIVHGVAQHGGQPRAYPFLKMVADLLDLGVDLEAQREIATWLSSDVSDEEIAALFDLANELAAGRPCTEGGSGAAVLLRHALLGAFDAEYRQALKLEFFAAAPSDRKRSLFARIRAALFLSDRQIDAIYGAPRSGLGYFGRRVARPFDLVLRAFAARSSARALTRRRGRASAQETPRKPV